MWVPRTSVNIIKLTGRSVYSRDWLVEPRHVLAIKYSLKNNPNKFRYMYRKYPEREDLEREIDRIWWHVFPNPDYAEK